LEEVQEGGHKRKKKKKLKNKKNCMRKAGARQVGFPSECRRKGVYRKKETGPSRLVIRQGKSRAEAKKKRNKKGRRKKVLIPNPLGARKRAIDEGPLRQTAS